MMHRWVRRAAAGVVLVAGLAAVLPALAAGFVDDKSGFAVDPPQPFIVAPAKTQTYDVAVIVNSLTGKPSLGAGDSFLCQVGYKSQPDNTDFAQEEINQQVEQPAWLDNAAAALSQRFSVTGRATFVLNGAMGIELIALPKDTAHSAGMFISMIDTPSGRTTLNCATRPEELDSAVKQFRLIRSGVTPGAKTP
jgi:hypothetical protein